MSLPVVCCVVIFVCCVSLLVVCCVRCWLVVVDCMLFDVLLLQGAAPASYVRCVLFCVLGWGLFIVWLLHVVSSCWRVLVIRCVACCCLWLVCAVCLLTD